MEADETVSTGNTTAVAVVDVVGAAVRADATNVAKRRPNYGGPHGPTVRFCLRWWPASSTKLVTGGRRSSPGIIQ